MYTQGHQCQNGLAVIAASYLGNMHLVHLGFRGVIIKTIPGAWMRARLKLLFGHWSIEW